MDKPDEFDEERCELLRDIPSLDNIFEFIKVKNVIYRHYTIVHSSPLNVV